MRPYPLKRGGVILPLWPAHVIPLCRAHMRRWAARLETGIGADVLVVPGRLLRRDVGILQHLLHGGELVDLHRVLVRFWPDKPRWTRKVWGGVRPSHRVGLTRFAATLPRHRRTSSAEARHESRLWHVQGFAKALDRVTPDVRVPASAICIVLGKWSCAKDAPDGSRVSTEPQHVYACMRACPPASMGGAPE